MGLATNDLFSDDLLTELTCDKHARPDSTLEIAALFRLSRPPSEPVEGGRRAARHPFGDQPPDQGTRGPSRREAVPAAGARAAPDGGRPGLLAGGAGQFRPARGRIGETVAPQDRRAAHRHLHAVLRLALAGAASRQLSR